MNSLLDRMLDATLLVLAIVLLVLALNVAGMVYVSYRIAARPDAAYCKTVNVDKAYH